MSEPGQSIFTYERWPHKRRHGPKGYSDYTYYKPWLRDEFHFRCVFCLFREKWCQEGEAAFSVEHFLPQSKEPSLICEYHNLLLACCGCNSAKRDVSISLNPGDVAMADHIEVKLDGTAVAITAEGSELIQICHLNRPKLQEYRERMIQLWDMFYSTKGEKSTELQVRFFGFPDNLPDLGSLRPPAGNSIPGGTTNCFCERRKRSELEDTY